MNAPQVKNGQTPRRRKKRIAYRKIVGIVLRVLGGVLALAVAISLLQVISAAYSGVKTEAALTYTAFDTITCPAIAFREESVISSDDSGVFCYQIQNGERAASGGVIANCYATEKDADTVLQIAECEEKIEQLELLRNQNSEYVPDLTLINGQIHAQLENLLQYSNGRNLSQTAAEREELLNLLNRKQVVTGQVSGFEDQINALKEKKKALTQKKTEASAVVRAPVSGFFSSRTDGYESLCTAQALEELTVESFRKLEAQEPVPAENGIGKIVTNYVWYLACRMSAEDAKLLQSEVPATVSVPLTSVQDAQCSVQRIIRDPNGQEIIAVLQIDSLTEDMIDLRKDVVQIRTNVYTGLKVSSAALRIVKEKKGVYILSGVEAKFIPVNILFSTVDYVLCEPGTGKKQLCLYDEVIIGGTDLYDGKVVD